MGKLAEMYKKGEENGQIVRKYWGIWPNTGTNMGNCRNLPEMHGKTMLSAIKTQKMTRKRVTACGDM